jgi:signal transduction histidine kinase
MSLSNWRVRWRLAAIIAVPVLAAAVLGSLFIYGDVNNLSASGRVQHLAQLNAAVVLLTQKLEDERDLSAGYAAVRSAPGPLGSELTAAQQATNAAVTTVVNDANGVGAGYQPGTQQNLTSLLDSLNDLKSIRQGVTSTLDPPSKIIQVYTQNVIEPANTFSASVGTGADDAALEGNVTTLGALLQVEDEMSVQRAILFAALTSPQQTLLPEDLSNLNQAFGQQTADQSNFGASAPTAEQQLYENTVAGTQVDHASSEESLAISTATTAPTTPLSREPGLTAANWYTNQTYTIGKVRQVANQLVSAITDRAGTLRSQATQALLITSLVALLVLMLVLVVTTIVTRSLIRPLRKLRADALDVAGHRLPEMVRRLSQSEGADEGVDIEPIGVTSTDEIGEVARAFDQVHREAVRLAADEAMLRGNLNAMFINLSRRSQSLIERQLSLIDSLEQSEQDSGRLSSLFRLDHLATRMRRNSENLLVLAGHEVTRRWSQPVPLVDVLRAAISEIEQYERVVLNVQPGIVVVGQAVNDVVHLVAEIVENATTFSPEDTQVYVSGQPLSSGGVLLDITDNGVGISDQEMSHANWRLDNPPVVDVAVSRRMGLFVVGRLAARHGVRVRLRHAQAGGLTALIWLPDTVAAPEVAPPLGRLRRFEADDFGPTPSLSAPPATSAAAQATAAARIPRFSPSAPGSPQPFSPAAGPSNPGTPVAPVAPGAPTIPSAPAAPGAGVPAAAGTGNGWESPSDWDKPDWGAPAGAQPDTTPALPVRSGNGRSAAAANGAPAAENAPPEAASPRPPTLPRPPAGPGGPGGPPGSPGSPAGGPSRLPAFGGQHPQSPIGGQNVRGGDGPSVSDPASATNAMPAVPAGQGSDGAAADPNSVTIPPAATHDQRLPIFDSLESDWFRRSGTSMNATRTQQAAQPAQAAAWSSPADEGWRAAEVVASPAAGETTQAGLPRRVPRANLVPGSVGGGAPGGQDAETGAPARSADVARSRMASFQRGVRDGRAAAPQQSEES